MNAYEKLRERVVAIQANLAQLSDKDQKDRGVQAAVDALAKARGALERLMIRADRR